MSLEFEWDARKDASNRRKHGVSFAEAATAFGDPRSLTVPDPDHSHEEDRFVLLGLSYRGRLLVVVHSREAIISASSAPPVRRRGVKGDSMAKPKSDKVNGMKEEYDFSGGARGKYAKRYAQGCNVVVLEPDVAKLYPDAEAVNRALRALAEAAPRTGRTGKGR